MRNKYFFKLAILLLFVSASFALPDTLWTKIYGGLGSSGGLSVQETTDGGYITAGYTSEFGAGGQDVWLIKSQVNGNTQWTNTFGGDEHDLGNSVQQTADGGYIIVGYTISFGAGSRDIWLIKTDANGDTLWTVTYGGNYIDEGNSVKQTSDGGYIVAGHRSVQGADGQDVWLLKTDANGDTSWANTYGGIYSDIGHSVQQTTDNGYVICGQTWSYGAGNYDIWLVKTDVNGDTLWTNTYGGINSEIGYSVQQTTDV